MKIWVLFLIFISFVASAQKDDVATLREMLDLDRFHAYIQSWGHTMAGRGKRELAAAVLTLRPFEIDALNLDPRLLGDAQHYDDLILVILKKTHPFLKVTKEDVAWSYNFYKNKLNEAYHVTEAASSPTTDLLPPADSVAVGVALKEADAEDVLLNVDSYASGRTTRAVFWEASLSSRKIELHVGTANDFKQDIAQRGVEVIGAVKTHARNYNPIFLLQEPGEKSFHYAVTEISGNDRLKHFQMQSSLVRWEKSKGKLAPPPPIEVVGDAARKLAAEEATLTQVLKVVPKADHVLIGQKGAFERTVGSLGKMDAILQMVQKNQEAVRKITTPEQFKLAQKALASKNDLTAFVMKNASDIDKLYESVQGIFVKNNIPSPGPASSFSLDRGSYEVSDYLLQGNDGLQQRWRVFSNVWGDEVLPVAGALKATGHTTINYMGTAGGLPNSNLKVGDLVVPRKSHDINGDVRKIQGQLIPPEAKVVDMVTHVSSPFEETKQWLVDRNKFAQIVEVETGYLSKVFSGRNDKLNTLLLVSDMVGVEGESLAEASSSVRRKAQIAGMSAILDQGKVVRPIVAGIMGNELFAWINEFAPNRDPVSKFQVYKAADARGLVTLDQVKLFLETEKSFTTNRLVDNLSQADFRLSRMLDEIVDNGIRPRVSIPREFLEGRWNPMKGPINLGFSVQDPEIEKELKAIIELLQNEDKAFSKYLQVTISNDLPAKHWVSVPRLVDNPNGTLLSLYKDTALGLGGLASTETRTGNLKFVQVTPPPSPTSRTIENLAFFGPDEETSKLLKNFAHDPKKIESYIKSKIDLYGPRGANKGWEIKFSKVPKLSEGALATISPELGADKLTIHMKFTPEGLKNAAVAFEEVAHLEQIVGGSFSHPYVWAEVVANAKAGSPRAMEHLARLEIDAINTTLGLDNSDAVGGIKNLDQAKRDAFYKARLIHAERIYKQVAKAAKADLNKRAAGWEKMKKAFDKMEKGKVKFNDLVARNDRKGVRNILEKYLPWQVMEPSEVNAWKEWLDAIEKPDRNKAKVQFRGIDGDVLVSNPQGNPGMLSTVLTKNQGNYTRRLRSLATMRDKIAQVTSPHGFKSSSLLTVMEKHAQSPTGSPFLSASNNSIASGFGYGKRVALNIDERRLVPNAMAWYFESEREKLIPLVVFPDEVIHLEDAGSAGIENEKFISNVEKKLGRKLTKNELQGSGSDKDFVRDGYQRAKTLLLDPKKFETVGACAVTDPNCACVFKTLNALLK